MPHLVNMTKGGADRREAGQLQLHRGEGGRLFPPPRDAQFALDYVMRNARTVEEQRGALAALRFKTDVLWAQLDALHHAYVDGAIPPGTLPAGLKAMDETTEIHAQSRPHLPRE